MSGHTATLSGARPVPPQRHREQDEADPEPLSGQLATAAGLLGLDADREQMLLLAGTFVRLIGALTLEFGGHFVGTFEPADQLYTELVEREADALGLRE